MEKQQEIEEFGEEGWRPGGGSRLDRLQHRILIRCQSDCFATLATNWPLRSGDGKKRRHIRGALLLLSESQMAADLTDDADKRHNNLRNLCNQRNQ